MILEVIKFLIYLTVCALWGKINYDSGKRTAYHDFAQLVKNHKAFLVDEKLYCAVECEVKPKEDR